MNAGPGATSSGAGPAPATSTDRAAPVPATDGAGGARSAPSRHASIVEFLTDGSLARLCAEFTRLTGVRADLRDPAGRVIVAQSEGWAVADPADIPAPVATFPLMLGGLRVGMLTLGPGEPVLAPDARDRLERVMTLLAQSTGEIVQYEAELRDRIREISALSRMSSLMVRAAGPEKVLKVALDSALDVLELDAGSIVLFREDPDGGIAPLEEDVLLKASRGLSREWLDNPLPLSKDRQFDRAVIAGRMVVVEDLLLDDRVFIREEVRREGLRSAIQAGLVFKERTLGVIRLYARGVRRFDEADKRLLGALAQQAAVSLEQSRLLRFEQEEQRVQRQLQLAGDVQRRMLPRGVPNSPQLEFAAKYIPSFELGGDFYDFIELSGHVGIAIGDVVGKGIAAALLMASVRSSLRAHAREVYDLDEVVARVNQALCRDMRDDEFASLWYGVIDPSNRRLTYCSAGHEPPMIVRVPTHRPPSSADVDELSVGGMVVGVDPSQRYQRAVFDLSPGDVLVGYTDGVCDAVNFAGERFGKARLRQAMLTALRGGREVTAPSVLEHILWEVRQFAGLAQVPDDKTLIVVRVRS
ncbi:MAG: GAF domain-containing SpoIIE family protein phosphatase [Planctomycetota bacterium]|nr:GAF domain-containing SpoIIE family protein phosphatase [Planctomycetota bacterium]